MAFISGWSMKLIRTSVWFLSCERKSDYQEPCITDALSLRHLQSKKVTAIEQNKNGVKIVHFETILK